MDYVAELPSLAALFELYDSEVAMSKLVFGNLPTLDSQPNLIDQLEKVPDAAVPGVWIYLDDLKRAHDICQDQQTPEGALWHAIVHRLEGDFWNSKYWLRQAGPATEWLDDPYKLVDDVQAAQGKDKPELVLRQRQEWLQLMKHCLEVAQ